MEAARRPRGLPTPTAQPGPRPRPAPRHSRPRPPPGSRQLQPPEPGGSLGWQAGGAEPRQTQPRWRALKNGARRPERRDIFFPLTELFPTSGCPTRYSSHSAALRDPPPPPPHPIASSPPSPSAASPAVPPPLRFKMAPSALRRLLQSNRRGQHRGQAERGMGAQRPLPTTQPCTGARRPAALLLASPGRARAHSSTPPRPAPSRAHAATIAPPLWPGALVDPSLSVLSLPLRLP